MSKITIEIDDEMDDHAEILARSIISVSEAFEKLDKSALTMRAIVLLVHDSCGGKVNKTQIELILRNAGKLKENYIKDII